MTEGLYSFGIGDAKRARELGIWDGLEDGYEYPLKTKYRGVPQRLALALPVLYWCVLCRFMRLDEFSTIMDDDAGEGDDYVSLVCTADCFDDNLPPKRYSGRVSILKFTYPPRFVRRNSFIETAEEMNSVNLGYRTSDKRKGSNGIPPGGIRQSSGDQQATTVTMCEMADGQPTSDTSQSLPLGAWITRPSPPQSLMAVVPHFYRPPFGF